DKKWYCLIVYSISTTNYDDSMEAMTQLHIEIESYYCWIVWTWYISFLVFLLPFLSCLGLTSWMVVLLVFLIYSPLPSFDLEGYWIMVQGTSLGVELPYT